MRDCALNDLSEIKSLDKYETPFYLFIQSIIARQLTLLTQVASRLQLKLLFPLKAFSITEILNMISPSVDGFSVSSANEARLASDIIGKKNKIHFSSPGLTLREAEIISSLCDYISFNSLSQLARFRQNVNGNYEIGLRINTQLSFIADERYNPCRKHSKLGVPIRVLDTMSAAELEKIEDVDGLLFHTNCESYDFSHLLDTILHIEEIIPKILDQVKWINVGGGYLFDEFTNWEPLEKGVNLLQDKYGLNIFFEPGKGIIGDAGYIVSTVLDVFKSDGKKIVILDTSVNHMPEVFEYQYKPTVMQESEKGKYRYILAGASCLTGDLFGEYRFEEPLEIGSRIVFEDMGAYTFVKANMFNGINLPSIYILKENGELQLIREFDYKDYLSIYGAKKDETVRKRNSITSNI